MLKFKKISASKLYCTLNVAQLYEGDSELLRAFDHRWTEFYASDEANQYVFTRKEYLISYPHKFWIPQKKDDRIPLMILGGNPAPHSVWKDIYYAYEGKGTEHRFWKVMRELGYVDLHGDDPQIKDKYLNLQYNSPFRIGSEAIFTFPSTPSKPVWSGVLGLEKLFGRRYLYKLYEIEKERMRGSINSFLDNGGAVIAMQKDAYNAVADNNYNLNLAVKGELFSQVKNYKVYGTPPTRWLYTRKMKNVLSQIKNEIISHNEHLL